MGSEMCIRDRDQTVAALVKQLERVSGDGEPCANVCIAREAHVDVPRKLGALVLVDRVLRGRIAAAHRHTALVHDAGLGVAALAEAGDELR